MDKQILKQLNLLLVDDNYRIHTELYALFSPMFKSITLAHDTTAAQATLQKGAIDIIITDIAMPGPDGLSFIEQVRRSDLVIPIIVLSAHSDPDYLLRAANLQIDGYIVKPLNFKKLEEALNRALKRLERRVKEIALCPQVLYHPLLKSLSVDGQEISLGQKECLLLELLLEQRGRVVSKSELIQRIWPAGEPSDSAVKNLLSELRKKLKYPLIHNYIGRGWHLEVEEE